MSYRDYQLAGIDGIKREFMSGKKKVLLFLATGGGKTTIFCKMVKDTVARGKRATIVVRGRKLVDQASARLFREGVPHGVLMASHWNYRPHERTQVCSIDTLVARNLVPETDLLVIDEAHLFDPDAKSGRIIQAFIDRGAFVVAVTATPYVQGGMRHIADSVVKPISMLQLIEQGYLVPFRYFAPAEPDLTGVKTVTTAEGRDYNTNQLADVMIEGQLTGKIIDHYIKIAKGLPALCFCVNVHHSKLLTEKFKNAGVKAEHLDASVTDSERNEAYKRLERGETEVICNVGIACTGVDIPPLRAVILARPTQSKNLFIQQCGRGTRPFAGKNDCIILDHAGNIKRHGLPTDEPDVNLDGRVTESFAKRAKTCKECFCVYEGPACPECGATPEAREGGSVDLAETDHELKEIAYEVDPILREYNRLKGEGRNKNRKWQWACYKLVEKYGIDRSRPYLPKGFLDFYERKQADLFGGSRFTGHSVG